MEILLSVEFDTAVELTEGLIDPNGGNGEAETLKVLNNNFIKYEIIDPNGPGGGWPIIEYTATPENLCFLLEIMDPYQRKLSEIQAIVKDFIWNGKGKLEDLFC